MNLPHKIPDDSLLHPHIVGMWIGIPAHLWFWYMTDWKLALALFLCMFANNLSQWSPPK